MPQPPFKLATRLCLLAAMASACLLCGSRATLGSGCHLADRAVHSHALTWDDFPGSRMFRDEHLQVRVHPAVMPPHCPGEVPTLPTATRILFAPQLQMGLPGAPGAGVEEIVIRCFNLRPPPLASRLDRPPRHAA
ncbi:MAG: hypothetical protein ACP5XB_07005 [Isosphaeraceae bacterium]